MIVSGIEAEILQDIIVKAAESTGGAGRGLEVSADMLLGRDLGFDSLDFIELVGAVESRLGIEVDDEALTSIKTVGDLHRYVIGAARAKAGAA